MTTVLIDFKEKKIVADKQRTYGMVDSKGDIIEAQVSRGTVCKIKQVTQGVFLVGAGDASEVLRQYEILIVTGMVDKSVEGDCTLAVVQVKGEGLLVDLYTYRKTRWTWLTGVGRFNREAVQGTTSCITFGSGGNYAYGAHKAGCSPEDSVRAASKCDEFTSYEIDVVELEEV